MNGRSNIHFSFGLVLSVVLLFFVCLVTAGSSALASSENERKIYTPLEFAQTDFDDPTSRWCYARSRQSEHFVLFWENAFGEDPQNASLPEKMRVNTEDLLQKAEQFYTTNAVELGFASSPKSWLDTYKMIIYLFYQEEWLAVGAGVDNVIGALWVNPAACSPAGAVLAHEVGHCFQYQVYADQLLNGMEDTSQSGFRYAYQNGMGNTFWEQCAQWQAWQDFPEEAFQQDTLKYWAAHCHRAFEHEWTRYQSYWFLYFVAQKHGQDAIGRLWQESRSPEDVLAVYRRLYCENDTHLLGEDLYAYASHVATWDFDACRTYADAKRNLYETQLYPADDGYWQIAYSNCPDERGFNVIPLSPEEYGSRISVHFISLPEGSALASGDPGIWYTGEDGVEEGGQRTSYNLPEGEAAGQGYHRYGFAALCKDGRRVYSESKNEANGSLTFTIPENTEALYFVVTAYAEEHRSHRWDEDELNDRQYPYRFRMMGD